MKKRTTIIYSLLTAASLSLLAGCEQPQAGGIAQIEAMRKNGNDLIESGKEQEAIAVFDKIIAIDPKNALAYNGKAVAFDHSGNHLAAQELYQTALKLSPNSAAIKNNLAMSLILNKQIKQAIAILEPLSKKPGLDHDQSGDIIRHNLALAYGISGQYDKATKINRKDLSIKEAKENIEFYKNYVAQNSGVKAISNNEHNVGFINPPQSPAPVKKPAPVAAKNTPAKIEAKPSEETSEPGFFSRMTSYDYPD
jgi:Flp pilus assembly protein TadD